MKVVVIGGTGHVGHFMVPKLVNAGFEVIVASSGRTPLPKDKGWEEVKHFKCDVQNIDQVGQLRNERPAAIVDMTGAVWDIYQKLKGVCKHVVGCGSLWMYGEPKVVPTPEQTASECVFDVYKKRYSQILQLVEMSKNDGVAFTAIMPPNICGPGKIPLDCLGGRGLDVHKAHQAGREVILPDGPDVLIGPCDAEDIAECFVKAVLNRERAAHQIFNVGAAYALTAAKFVSAYAEIYQVEIPIKRVSWSEYITNVSPGIGYWWHFKAHMCPDISKAKKLLMYQPKYTPEMAMHRAVEWMQGQKLL